MSRLGIVFALNLLNVVYGFCGTISMVAIAYVISHPILKWINSDFSLRYEPGIALAINAVAIVIVYLISNKLEIYERRLYMMGD